MKFSFQASREGSRNNSVTAIFHHLSAKSQPRKKTAMSMVETADEYDMIMPPAQPKKKRSTFAGFFKGWGSGKMSNKARYRASKVMKAPSPKGGKQQLKSFDIDDALIERVMGKPKDAKHASENFLLQQRIRARSRSRTRGADSTDEPRRGDGQRGRSMPLTTEEAQHMFVGAPYFNVGKTKNGYRPQVVFVDEKSKVYNPSSMDHRAFSHASFEASTLATEHAKRDAKSMLTNSRTALFEIPNMLAQTGTEMGTTSFEHFLQLAVSDSVKYLTEPPRYDNRKLVYISPEKLGLREVNTDANIERLTALGELHAAQRDTDHTVANTNEYTISEMGAELFMKLLNPPSSLELDAVILRVQIEALQKVLGLKELWHDFSLPDTRLRIGQLLWSTPSTWRRVSYVDKDLEPNDRELVLLQITLASELLVRLAIVKAVSSARGRAPAFLSEADRISIENQRTAKVNWDLVLAERFLDNISVSLRMPLKPNRNGLFSAISYLATKEEVQPFYQPKNQEQQISGLLHFAETLQWPHTEKLEKELIAKLMRSPEEQAANVPQDDDSVYATPLQSPWSGWTGEPEYPGASEKAQRFLGIPRRSSRPSTAKSETGSQLNHSLGRNDTAQCMQLYRTIGTEKSGTEVNVGGWLSRSWLSGLVMPGESSGQFLISTLLENTPDAIDVLGDTANLHSGFVYKGRSYWSKSHVVGRVMAAAKGASECMGWISVPGTTIGRGEGWVGLSIQDVPYCDASTIRITDSEAVGRDSDPMGVGERMAVQQTDFTFPHDGPPVMGNEVRSRGLAFKESHFAGESCLASITFSSPINSKLSTLEVSLTYDVQFISSYPCHPEQRKIKPKETKKAKPQPVEDPAEFYGDCLPSDFQEAEPPKDSARCSHSPTGYIMPDEAMAELPPPPCHALHSDYRFETIPVATLLSAPPEQRPRVLSMPDARLAYPQESPDEVVVLDCRGTEDLELLARGWCAQVGENAIVAKAGRTCIACSHELHDDFDQ